MRTGVRSAVVAAVIGAALLLAGCAPTVALHPAPPHANDPACADLIVRMQDQLTGPSGQLPRRDTDAQATAAWGDPTSVILSCGVKVPSATTLPCFAYDNTVFWLRQKDDAQKVWHFTTFGRNPAVELTVSTKLSPGPILDQLNSKIDFFTPKNGHECSSTEDTVTGDSLPSDTTPTPTPTPAG